MSIVEADLANDLWPADDPIGKCVPLPGPACYEVVGIIEERRSSSVTSTAMREFFLPLGQALMLAPNLVPETLFVRTRESPSEATALVSAAVTSVSADLPFPTVRPLMDLVDVQTRSRRLGRAMFSLFGLLALSLVAVGIYGLVSFAVRQQLAEIGIRMSLGAVSKDILSLVMREGIMILASGCTFGVIAAWGLTRFIRGYLYGIAPADPTTFCVALVVVSVPFLAAGIIPALKATRVDPAVVLRHEG